MDDLIRRQEALKALSWDTEAYMAINMLPSADALEVVRCKDCKCKDKYENFCWMLLREIDPSDYCSYAERKE